MQAPEDEELFVELWHNPSNPWVNGEYGKDSGMAAMRALNMIPVGCKPRPRDYAQTPATEPCASTVEESDSSVVVAH